MKTTAKFIAVFAAASAAFLSASRAQVTTLSTVGSFAGGQFPISPSQTVGETFTGIAAINSFTYSFFSSGNSNATVLAAQWAVYNGSGSMSLLSNWTTVQSFGTISIPAFTGANTHGWTQFSNGNGGPYNTYNYNFNFGTFLQTNPSATYALLLTNQSNSTTAGATLGFDFSNAFTYGDASVGFGNFADYTFSNIVYIKGGDIVPTPESSTVAAILGCVLVAGLVGFRLRQQRQMALAPITQTVA